MKRMGFKFMFGRGDQATSDVLSENPDWQHFSGGVLFGLRKMSFLWSTVFACLAAAAAQVEEIAVSSPSMEKDVPVSVILPVAYSRPASDRFPVIYMLHGANGDHRSYADDVTRRLSDEYSVIAVCPNGAKTSWWLDSPVDPKSKYETFVSRELVAAVDAKYRTRADREHRAVMGGSMGGHGACWVGFRNKTVFGAVGDVFGGLELRPHAGKWGLDCILGDVKTHPEVWDAHSVLTLAPALKNGEQEIICALGTEDFFIEGNRKFHDILAGNKVAHTYIEVRGPDQAHSWHSGEVFQMVEPTLFRFFDGYFKTGKGQMAELDTKVLNPSAALAGVCPEGSVFRADLSAFDAASGVFHPQWTRPADASRPDVPGHPDPRKGGMLWRAGEKRTFVAEFDGRFVGFTDAKGAQFHPWNDWMKYTLDIGSEPIHFVGAHLVRIISAELPAAKPGTLCNAPIDQTHAKILWTKPICKEPGRYLAWPTVCRRKSGELIAVFSGNRTAHVSPDGQVQLVRSVDGGETWSMPETVKNGVLDDRDAGILELDDGTLLIKWFTSINFTISDIPAWADYYKTIPEDAARRTFGSFVTFSKDGGKTWSDGVRTIGSTPHGPIKLKDGRLLLVATKHHDQETVHVFRESRAHDVQTVEESRDDGRTWKMIGHVPGNPPRIAANKLCEPHAVELPDGKIVAMFRWEMDCGHLLQSESADGGTTWTPPEITDMDGYPPHLMTLDDGSVLCTYSSRRDGRWGEYARISRDGCRTWNAVGEIKMDGLPLETTSYGVDFGYPTTVRLADGAFLTVYYRPDKPGELPCVMATKWQLK